ncbi:MAG: L,D-transpeptidase family protein [Desulfovibrio sp.]|nr:L,D-transpeptidase family protein [Desulfovibrio sp.]
MHCKPSLPDRNYSLLPNKTRSGRIRGLSRLLSCLGCFALGCFFWVGTAAADAWHARISDTGLPGHLVAVDKARQTFMFFERKSPLKLKYSYPCTTGQRRGDKQALNDLRTPEGVYFVEYKIASGLDFKEYGGIAYTLNYPNPVDRLRGKTGHGIWIHSKGFGIEPTRGCVAIGLKDIDEVGPSLVPGTAVLLAERLDVNQKSEKDGTVLELRQRMQDWTNAWSARSTALFDFYDDEAYGKAMSESFGQFRQNKERLFAQLEYIKIFNRNIHVLEGPGYWVTWTEQLYTASNLSTEGIRRLYWQRGADKQLRIVGMEWTPRDLGLQAAYNKGQLVAEAPVYNISDATLERPLAPRLELPETLSSAQSESAVAQGGVLSLAAASNLATPPLAATPAILQPETLSLTSQTRASLENALAAWFKRIAEHSPNLAELYDQAQFNRVPRVPRGSSYATVLRTWEQRGKQPWLRLISRKPSFSVQNGLAQSETELLVITPRGLEQGVLSQWWRKDEDFRIVAESFKPAELGLAAEWLEEVSDDISQMIERWREAWQKGDADAYVAFYTEDAVQQGRRGAQAIRKQKADLWQRSRPGLVELSGLRLMVEKQGIRADMMQTYTDTAGRKDKGVKTLQLRYDGQNWRIAREDWTVPGRPVIGTPAVGVTRPPAVNAPGAVRQPGQAQSPRFRRVLPSPAPRQAAPVPPRDASPRP